MYWIPKNHKTPIKERFIVASLFVQQARVTVVHQTGQGSKVKICKIKLKYEKLSK